MLADVYARQVQLAERGRSLDGKVDAGRDVGKAVAKLIHKFRCDGIRVRDQQAAIVDGVYVVRQKIIRDRLADVLPAEARIGRLLRGDRLVDANVGAVGARGG